MGIYCSHILLELLHKSGLEVRFKVIDGGNQIKTYRETTIAVIVRSEETQKTVWETHTRGEIEARIPI